MAWTTRKVYIDQETNEVLTLKDLANYHLPEKAIPIYQKINETHTERILIYKCKRSDQGRLFG